MQHTSSSHTLSPAAQAANAERDGSVAPYLNDAAVKFHAVDACIGDAMKSIAHLYAHSDAEQKPKIEALEARLSFLRADAHSIRQDLQEARPKYNQSLAKDGQSQFNGAARGDARSVVTHLERQHRPAERLPGVLTPQLRAAALDAGQKKTPALENTLGSKQVRDHQPQPVPRPTPEFAQGADAAKHRAAMSADALRANERNAYLQALASDLRADRNAEATVERTPTLG